MDNLQVHKNANVIEKYAELNFDVLFNVVYMPDFNPIETVFAQVKLFYKAERL